jgi:excisionase family DNA binding protein
VVSRWIRRAGDLYGVAAAADSQYGELGWGEDRAKLEELPLHLARRIAVATEVDVNQGGAVMADAREVMNIRQASQYLGVSPDTLYKYVSEEKIPAFKLGNRWKFKKSILDSWMEDKSLTSGAPQPRKLTKTSRAAVTG